MKKIILFWVYFLMAYFSYAQVPTSGLVAEYTFNDGTGSETNPNGYGPNNATLKNTTTATDRFGNANYAQDLDGQLTTYINLGTSSVLTPAEGTISIWVLMDTISPYGYGFNYSPMIMAKNTNAPGSYMEGYDLSVRRSDRKLLTLTTQSGTTNEIYFFTNVVSYDDWHHYVMTYAYDSLKVYMDGVFVQSKYKGFTSTFHSGDSVMVGNSANSSNNRAFDGIFDDIRIYDRVLSQAGVDSLFNEGDPTTPPPLYAELVQKLDGGYIQLEDDSLRFKFLQEYAIDTGDTISYKIYPWDRQSPTSGAFEIDYGINWEEINVSGLTGNAYYTLEFKANKEEIYLLRFKTQP